MTASTKMRPSSLSSALGKKAASSFAGASPLLANIYLPYVFDLWVQAWRKKRAHGDVIVVRYADDIVVGLP
ncbi:MAG: hypothetical protein ACRD27_07015 [Terracidiphilus sp.]